MKPVTENDLSEIVKGASQPFHIRGGGTRNIGKPVNGAVLNTEGLSGITLYEPGALTLVAKAGTSLAEIEQALDAENQRLPFEPMDHRGLLGTSGTPTIGGVVAGNVSGPRRIQAGACRDFMLGVRFVDGTGRIIKNGGRVMKNVTGYDLVKLMTGSWGSLGVLTEVSMKVLPKPETAACVLINGLSDAEAVSVMSKALGSPYEVTGAAHTSSGVDGDPVTMLRIEGFEQSVAYRADQLQALFSEHDVVIESDPARVAAGWEWVRDVQPMHGTSGDVWRFSVKPSDAPALVAALKAEHPVNRTLYDWGGGLIWVETDPGTNLRPDDLAGHATLIRAEEKTRQALPVFQPESAGLSALTTGIRARFDPKALFNPGLMSA
ncbi:FAD-binding protein [Thalassococcus lentus]|uniref:FAD-binding protein n=1 Tax=Thalassococcus lentus TaxID=1210524 RepID=A0ABT4XMQ5_9RHOB|nr:FAD-binding protein [Thalassococcus lentus]MDA7423224.1 FAD-binding protein [Thalassococcus lentus]